MGNFSLWGVLPGAVIVGSIFLFNVYVHFRDKKRVPARIKNWCFPFTTKLGFILAFLCKSVLFDIFKYFHSSLFFYFSILENYHIIKRYIIGHLKLMRDDDDTIFTIIEITQKISNCFKSINIKSWVYFIQNDIFWFEQMCLQDFYFSYFSTTKSNIEITG